MTPTRVTIPDPTAVLEADCIPSGLCQFDSWFQVTEKHLEPEQKIYFKREPHLIEFVIAFGSSRGMRTWVNSSYGVKKDGYYSVPSECPYLFDLISPVTKNQFIELFITCADPHPASNWLLFNLDMVQKIE